MTLSTMDTSRLLKSSAKPTNPSEVHAMCKAIDEFDAEGSFILAAGRVNKYFWSLNGLFYYAFVSSIEEFLYAISLNGLLHSQRVDQQLALGLTVDFECFRSIFDTPANGIVPEPSPGPTDPSLGRHAVQIIGFDDRLNSLQFQNSWGQSWGNRGLGYLPLKYLEKFGREILFWLDARWGLTSEKFEKSGRISEREITTAWLQENKSVVETIHFEGREVTIVRYSALNMLGEIVEIFDLRDPESIRVGWAHLRHLNVLRNPIPTSLVEELFIWPLFRRRGYGTLLESYCRDYALGAKSSRMKITFTEMDHLKKEKAPVRLFAAKLGYAYTLEDAVFPCTQGYAYKDI